MLSPLPPPLHSADPRLHTVAHLQPPGLISNDDETDYRSEVSHLALWCVNNNLSLSERGEDKGHCCGLLRRTRPQHAPLTINGATVERVCSTKFLGVHVTEDLSWTINTTSLAKKANQRLYFLRKLRKASPSCVPSTEAPSRAS
ncbi:hypothetical protein L3Q82_004124 [Scortum barcoo]|uniref:Uncharacterized protein n=1 Tax=Scortum barcoo TaxID=214431 RepID=A0ACB8X804_9TELE|nr:hypothetical protein L3Q82_004124 [Scortum barcoo]